MADGPRLDRVAKTVLAIDPEREPLRAHLVGKSPQRVKWVISQGYQRLQRGDG
jgi:hypothetical protein